MKNNILHITMSLNIGGAETHVVEVAKELSKEYNVIVASSGGTYVDELKTNNIVHYNVPFNSKNPFKLIKSMYLLKSIIKREKIDIIHSHARIPSFVAGFVRRVTKTPFVTTTHGHFKVTPFLRTFTFWGEHSIAVSKDLKDYLIKEYNFSSEKVSLTVNGINTSVYKPCSTQKSEIVHVSRLDDDTSLVAEILVQNAKKIYDETGLKIKIVGAGSKLEHLKIQANNLGVLDKYIHFTGASEAVYRELESAKVFVGISRALLEAMCFDIPVILAGNVGYGGIVDSKNVYSFIDTNFTGRQLKACQESLLISDLISASKTDEKFNWSYDFIQENYSTGVMCSSYLELYKSILTRPKKYVICGYYGYKNSGDDSLLASVVKTIFEVNPNNSVVILTKKESDYNFDNVIFVDRFSLVGIISHMWKTDILVMGGGSLIQDKTSSRSLYYYLFVIRTAALFSKKIYMYANGFGPIDKKTNQHITKWVLNKVTVITFRDKHSYHFMKKIGVKNPKMLVTADSVYSVNKSPTLSQTKNNRAVFIIRNWEGADVFIKELALFADYLKRIQNIEVVFLPLKLPDDLNISKAIASLMNEEYSIVELSNEGELIDYISTSLFSVSMRFHGVIYSSIASVVSIGLNYDKKVESICETLNLPCLKIADITKDNLIEEFDYIYQNIDNVTENMVSSVNHLIKRSYVNKEILYKI